MGSDDNTVEEPVVYFVEEPDHLDTESSRGLLYVVVITTIHSAFLKQEVDRVAHPPATRPTSAHSYSLLSAGLPLPLPLSSDCARLSTAAHARTVFPASSGWRIFFAISSDRVNSLPNRSRTPMESPAGSTIAHALRIRYRYFRTSSGSRK